MEPVKLVGTNLAALESDFASFGKTDRIYFDTEIAGFGLRFRSPHLGAAVQAPRVRQAPDLGTVSGPQRQNGAGDGPGQAGGRLEGERSAAG